MSQYDPPEENLATKWAEKRFRDSVIEECAKVAEDYATRNGYIPLDLIAAIRALKE